MRHEMGFSGPIQAPSRPLEVLCTATSGTTRSPRPRELSPPYCTLADHSGLVDRDRNESEHPKNRPGRPYGLNVGGRDRFVFVL